MARPSLPKRDATTPNFASQLASLFYPVPSDNMLLLSVAHACIRVTGINSIGCIPPLALMALNDETGSSGYVQFGYKDARDNVGTDNYPALDTVVSRMPEPSVDINMRQRELANTRL